MDKKCIRSYISITWDYIRSILATMLTGLSLYIIIVGLINNLNIAGNIIIITIQNVTSTIIIINIRIRWTNY